MLYSLDDLKIHLDLLSSMFVFVFMKGLIAFSELNSRWIQESLTVEAGHVTSAVSEYGCERTSHPSHTDKA